MGISVLQGTLPENTDWEHITTVSFTAASSVNVDDCFSADFSHYLVTRNLLGSVADERCEVRLRVGGADDSGANYRRQRLLGDGASVSGIRATGETYWAGALGYTNTVDVGFAMLRISNPFEAVRTTAWSDNGYFPTGDLTAIRLVCAHDSATSYTGFSVIPASGTITGEISVWGIA
jgi:hypothetical protein